MSRESESELEDLRERQRVSLGGFESFLRVSFVLLIEREREIDVLGLRECDLLLYLFFPS